LTRAEGIFELASFARDHADYRVQIIALLHPILNDPDEDVRINATNLINLLETPKFKKKTDSPAIISESNPDFQEKSQAKIQMFAFICAGVLLIIFSSLLSIMFSIAGWNSTLEFIIYSYVFRIAGVILILVGIFFKFKKYPKKN
jgi:hypothetical protein